MIPEIGAGLLAILEPDTDVARDTSLTRPAPFEWAPDTLYLWPSTPVVDAPIETGPTVRTDFAFTALWVTAGAGDTESARNAAMQAALDAKRVQYLDAVRHNQRSAGVWDFIRAAEAPAPPVARDEQRGLAIAISGYLVRT